MNTPREAGRARKHRLGMKGLLHADESLPMNTSASRAGRKPETFEWLLAIKNSPRPRWEARNARILGIHSGLRWEKLAAHFFRVRNSAPGGIRVLTSCPFVPL
jgi:hypothetical protein